MNKLKTTCLFIFIFNFLFVKSLIAQSTDKLWYRKPATYFEETLVLGNGKMGATIYGGTVVEKILLNDITLWSGEPVDPYMNRDAHKYVSWVRDALFSENYKLADSLNRFLQGKYSESYAPLGNLLLYFSRKEGVNYYRELDLTKALAKITYKKGDVEFTRDYFVSHPDKVMVIRITANKKEALSFVLQFNSLLPFKVKTENPTQMVISGYAPIKAAPNYLGDFPNAVVFDPQRGTRFATAIKVIADGRQRKTDTSLVVSKASEVIILVATETSFNGFDKDPVSKGKNADSLVRTYIKRVENVEYKKLLQAHIQDYSRFYNRVKLSLGKTNAPDLPTDERLVRYGFGHEDKNLEILYFNFGRYLLISSSRTEGVPANLQGIWNPYIRPPWSSNYTLNINAEQNYWPAEIANLSEMHWPFLSFIGNIAQTGKITAQTFYGVKNGWTACHNSDIWAMSNPVGDFGKGDPVWANWNMAGAWLSTHLWEHYLFTKNEKFLENYAYQLMKGAAQFCLEWLVEDKNGYLVTAPSTSPENRYKTPEGYIGATLYGSTSDIGMIRECFINFIEASKILNYDVPLREQIEKALKRLYPYKIGAKGHLQEWYHDWEDEDPLHRHQSHLFGLYPGHHIYPETTPELAEACRNTLEIKGDESTGWSKGWRINLWARLKDGNRAYKLYRELLKYVEPDEARGNKWGGAGGTYPNLMDAHPPFQIDGNFGGTAGVIEMLMQSTPDKIYLLPALPDAWSEGSITGICARGGFVIDMVWTNKKPDKVTIYSRKGGSTKLIFGNKVVPLQLNSNETKEINW